MLCVCLIVYVLIYIVKFDIGMMILFCLRNGFVNGLLYCVNAAASFVFKSSFSINFCNCFFMLWVVFLVVMLENFLVIKILLFFFCNIMFLFVFVGSVFTELSFTINCIVAFFVNIGVVIFIFVLFVLVWLKM